ncbi:hypothetical protein GMORB2_0685 [Geosmithia morbida]|uniref:HNH nuclease domain-containing protein n=1 Tax=Geosmithia morbida TaxID=1094350 RepID=A0A9P5D450_9HYPO|nr:uncharacterized protein GMORB2_0685 [Geosmithia morbida]KAF4126948.1 hypothetical protein GMORB2_0685 [Geosmithia morbida]
MSRSLEPVDVVVPSISYLGEMEERLQLARDCLGQVRRCDSELADYQLNLMQLSIVLTIDIHDLRYLSIFPGSVLYSILEHTEMFLSGGKSLEDTDEPTLVTDISVEEPSEDAFTSTPVEAEPSSRAAERAQSEKHAKGGASGGPSPPPPPSRRAQGTPRGPRGEQARRVAEVKLVRERDNRGCVVTHRSHPEAAHIVPYAMLNSPVRVEKARTFLTVFLQRVAPRLSSEVHQILIPSDPQTRQPVVSGGDYAFNMISLNKHLHSYWDQAIFGLKPVQELEHRFYGDGEKTRLVRVEWRWMPTGLPAALAKSTHVLPLARKSRLAHCRRKVDLDSEGLGDFLCSELQKTTGDEAHSGDGGDGGDVTDLLGPGLPIESGYRFDLRVAAADAYKMEALLRFQWLSIQMAAISGAAEVQESLRDEPDDRYKAIYQRLEAKAMKEVRDQSSRLGSWGDAGESSEEEDGSGR